MFARTYKTNDNNAVRVSLHNEEISVSLYLSMFEEEKEK